MKRHFTLVYWKEADLYVGCLKEIPSVLSDGKALEELRKNVQETYKLWLEDHSLPAGPEVMQEEIEIEV